MSRPFQFRPGLLVDGPSGSFAAGSLGQPAKASRPKSPPNPSLADFIHPAHSCAAPSSACAARTHHLLILYHSFSLVHLIYLSLVSTLRHHRPSSQARRLLRRPRTTKSISADHCIRRHHQPTSHPSSPPGRLRFEGIDASLVERPTNFLIKYPPSSSRAQRH